jgi:hypothetical protein
VIGAVRQRPRNQKTLAVLRDGIWAIAGNDREVCREKGWFSAHVIGRRVVPPQLIANQRSVLRARGETPVRHAGGRSGREQQLAVARSRINARERVSDEQDGYEFSVLGDFHANVWHLFGCSTTIRNGLAVRHVERGNSAGGSATAANWSAAPRGIRTRRGGPDAGDGAVPRGRTRCKWFAADACVTDSRFVRDRRQAECRPE